MTYSQITGHRSMVLDEQRNAHYSNAIKKLINGQSIVLDLGAGLGIHGLIAARAGAKKVYLVEPKVELSVIVKIAQQNHLTGNIQCIKGSIEEVDLPASVDVIISVFTGNFLLEEDLLPSLFYARDRYLASDGILIPDRAKMELVPVCAPDYFDSRVSCWSNHSQTIEFGLVREYAANTIFYDDHRAMAEGFLAEPAEIFDLDFMTAAKAECRNRINISITRDGSCHGLLGWFQTRLGDTWLSTSPLEPETHWRQAFLPLDPPIAVKSGEVISVQIQRPEFGEWTWTVETGKSRQRHSTFLSEPVSRSRLQKNSDDYKAILDDKGRAAKAILEMLNGEMSTDEISGTICKSYPHLFPGNQHAKRFVLKLIECYT